MTMRARWMKLCALSVPPRAMGLPESLCSPTAATSGISARAMFRDPKINVPVLGIVDNMAWFTPEKHPDERYYIFGSDEAVRRTAGTLTAATASAMASDVWV